MKVHNLDDTSAFSKLDPAGMLPTVLSFPDMLETARRIALDAHLMPPETFRNVVVSGLGGSAIGGDLARALLGGSLRIPMAVNRDYGIPAFVGEGTLFIASSYSGNTEETLAATQEAQEHGATIVTITSGGRLRELAHEGGHPTVLVPGGYQPRAALAFSLVPVLVILMRLGAISIDDAAFDEAVEVARSIASRHGPDVATEKNPAKRLAENLCGRLPVIYGSEGYRGVVALRWKGQINENAKAPAAANVFPELNHNEILSWSGPEAQLASMHVVILRDPRESRAIAARVELTKAVIAKHAGITEVWSEGSSSFAKLCSLVYIADFVSVYLAYLYGVDPSTIDAIDFLKHELAKLPR
ncbi:MAG TPA: bifunctional phosphoglucose/phosphomannose isomerase [Candidatus Binatia bacterium]|nr:bifunctional phosphoglucose/phosphomannose isomerase [Candidatus Binatia bacterium]